MSSKSWTQRPNGYRGPFWTPSSHIFPTHSPGGITLFDFVVVHKGSKLCGAGAVIDVIVIVVIIIIYLLNKHMIKNSGNNK